MTSLPCPLPDRGASNVVFPDLAPALSVVAAYPLGLSPGTAASPDLSYSQSYGHPRSYSHPGPATPGDSYLPRQQQLVAPSQPFHRPAEHPQELEADPASVACSKSELHWKASVKTGEQLAFLAPTYAQPN